MFVLLNSCGNIDHNQNPDESLYGVPTEWKPVHSLEEASKACREYIDKYDLGGGNWTGGYVFETLDFRFSEQIAYISYNGRIWTEGEYMLKFKDF